VRHRCYDNAFDTMVKNMSAYSYDAIPWEQRKQVRYRKHCHMLVPLVRHAVHLRSTDGTQTGNASRLARPKSQTA
jgi:hypothetical protein